MLVGSSHSVKSFIRIGPHYVGQDGRLRDLYPIPGIPTGAVGIDFSLEAEWHPEDVPIISELRTCPLRGFLLQAFVFRPERGLRLPIGLCSSERLRRPRGCAVACASSVERALLVWPMRSVGKSSGNLREVWSGHTLSQHARIPLTPPYIASPSVRLAQETSDCEQLYVYVQA